MLLAACAGGGRWSEAKAGRSFVFGVLIRGFEGMLLLSALQDGCFGVMIKSLLLAAVVNFLKQSPTRKNSSVRFNHISCITVLLPCIKLLVLEPPCSNRTPS